MKRALVSLTLLLLAAGPAARSQAPGEDFAPCPDAAGAPLLAGSLCAHFQVPRERGTPNGAKITLFLRQFPAPAPSHGQVWLVGGGAGSKLYPMIGALRQAFPGYDLIVPDRRGPGRTAAYDLQAEIDRYSAGGSTLLYGASQGSEVVLKALPLVRPRRVEAVILDNPAVPAQPSAPLSATTPKDLPGQVPEAGIDMTPPPRTLVLQSRDVFTPPADLDRKAPLTVYKIEGAPDNVMLTVPQCAAPLVRDFVENAAAGGAPCAIRLTIRF